MLSFISYFLYDVLALMYLYSFITSRGRANLRIPVALFTYSSRGRALCYLVSVLFAERFAPHLRRAATLSAVRRLAFALNQISLLSVEIPNYRAVPRGLDRIPASLPCSLALFFIFLFVGPAASLPRSKSARLCYSRFANTTRSAVFRSNRVDSPPRL